MRPPRWSRSALVSAALLLGATGASGIEDPPARWTASDEMLLFFDAATKIRDHGLASLDLVDVVEQSLGLVLADLDPYSHFLSAEAYARFREAQRPDYGGVGMELSRDRQGRLRCLPYPDTPASKAGIWDGDILTKVNGIPVQRQHPTEIGWRIRGAPDTAVRLTVHTGRQPPRETTLLRTVIRAPTVTARNRGGLPWIRLFRFGPTTTDELKRALTPLSGPVVLDLRGNPGGSLYDAIDAASLFLPKGAVITGIRNRSSTTWHSVQADPAIPETPLVLIQDERTASAAELFIAALTGHDRARSAGAPTFGKGASQQLFELVDGSALLLTDAVFLQPDESPIPAEGLAPNIPLDPAALSAAELKARLAAP